MNEDTRTLEELVGELASRLSDRDMQEHQVTLEVTDKDTDPHIVMHYEPLGTRAVAEIDAMVEDIAHEVWGVTEDDEPMFRIFSNLAQNMVEVWLAHPDHEGQFAE